MADPRTWPALVISAPDVDLSGDREGHLAAVLDDFSPAAIEDLAELPLPPGGLWDPSFPPIPPPPPAPLHWRVFFDGPATRAAARAEVARVLPDLTLVDEDVADDDWAARSQRGLTRVEVGPFVIAPPWDRPAEVPAGTTLLIIEPSMGFGTGHHQTTRLCLRLLATFDVTGQRVLDIGTGSGVLAMAAARRGATDVEGIDLDPDAVQSAHAGAALNDLTGLVTFQEADFRTTPPAPADLVFANLTGGMILMSAAALVALVRPGGHLILSGFTTEERAGVFEAMRTLSLVRTDTEDEWCTLAFKRTAPGG
ncbi:MAG: 50S ribosomal protein L11 methyltransferase [Vicinamibacterales bacterium]|nr:50S ribosomal protein L11 methyltransferase [Vicinamibacterales bacterium]